MKDTLAKIAKLYDLVEEMRGVIAELRELKVDVHIGRDGFDDYGMTDKCAIRVTLRPGCDVLEPR